MSDGCRQMQIVRDFHAHIQPSFDVFPSRYLESVSLLFKLVNSGLSLAEHLSRQARVIHGLDSIEFRYTPKVGPGSDDF